MTQAEPAAESAPDRPPDPTDPPGPPGPADRSDPSDPHRAAAPPPAEVEGVRPCSPFRRAWLRFRRDRVAVAALAALALIVLFALLAPLWARLTGHPYHATFPRTGLDPAGQPVGPSAEFWLGADQLGRDVLVRAAYGARVSLLVGVCSATLASAAGVAAGLAAGFAGGAADALLARLMDVTLALPYLLVAITLATAFPIASAGGGLAMTVLVIAFFSFAAVGRVVRGQVLSLREEGFVEAARALGAGPLRIMFAEVLPNLAGPVAVLSSLLIPAAIVFEATLSFLGVGVRAPMPSWGGMLGEGGEVFQTAWWLLAVPGVLLLLTTLSFNLVGDGVRDALAPRRAAGRGR
ncbi:ABC transporter permease [Actinomadura rugatobispora]|uniref:ABC transporter permease n=1 Tax=Actinomadura rugatobispora TaxID=1994 RepID=A0ABW1A510_9ACTN|nr:ABC transporter permease [Actinomadura rugatobispora]